MSAPVECVERVGAWCIQRRDVDCGTVVAHLSIKVKGWCSLCVILACGGGRRACIAFIAFMCIQPDSKCTCTRTVGLEQVALPLNAISLQRNDVGKKMSARQHKSKAAGCRLGGTVIACSRRGVGRWGVIRVTLLSRQEPRAHSHLRHFSVLRDR